MLLQGLLEEDPLLKRLLYRLNLTPTQLDTLLIEKTQKEADLELKCKLRDSGPVTKGAYIRTLRQAEQKVRKAIYTLLVTQYLGLIDPTSLNILIRAGEILSEHQHEELSRTHVQTIIDTIDRLVEAVIKGE